MRYFLIVYALLVPSLSFAQGAPRDFKGLVGLFLDIIDLLIVGIFAITFIVFIWGITKAWILNAGDAAEIDKGKQLALWGIIGLVGMSGIWGILYILRYSLFGL